MKWIPIVALILASSLRVHAQTKPSTTPAIPENVRSLLDDVRQAYSSAQSLQMSGTISFQFQSDSATRNLSSNFTASFKAPNQFRHEAKDDVLVVGTGKKVYAYLSAKDSYLQSEAPKTRDDIHQITESILNLLADQNPSLLMALAPDAGKQLLAGAAKIARAPDAQIDGKLYPAISFARGKIDWLVAFDPATHFIRQVRLDQKRMMEARGLTDLKSAVITIDYATTSTTAAPEALFAWAPPKDATPMKEDVSDDDSAAPGEAAVALVGKPAPDFTLPGLDNKPVALADLKGSVIVVDFWATWCGPCVASLPHLDKLYGEKSADGLKVVAIDLKETKATVQKFVESKHLGLPVLLDGKGEIAKSYFVSGIPQTVVIGKDGIVRKVIIGFGGDESELRAAVEAAMSE